MANASEGIDFKYLIESAGGSAEGELGIEVVGSSAVGAYALDHVEAGKANADSVNQLLIEGACGGSGLWWRSRWIVGEDAESVEESVSGDALAGERS